MGSRVAAPGQRGEKLCLLILLAGAVLKLCYAIQVPYSVSPHDLGGPSDWVSYSGGHLSYIQYLYQLRQLWQGNVLSPASVSYDGGIDIWAVLSKRQPRPARF